MSQGERPLPNDRARPSLAQALGIPLNVLLFLLLMVMAWGSWGGFFAHPVRAGVVWLHLAMMPVMTLCTSGRSRGVKSTDWKPFFPLLVFHSLFTAWVMPYMDARDIWVLPGGDALRWTGFVVLVAGGLLRVIPMMTLGRRFSSTVALQGEAHRLQTSGIYALARHPSYLGILLMDLGFVGVFRSVVALALMPLVFWMFKRRMDVEESFMVGQFGEAYRAYMAQTPRLLPRVY